MRFMGKAVSAFLVAATIVSFSPTLLWAGAETGGGSIFQSVINPNASGTKVSGPVTVFYDLTGVDISVCPSGFQITQFSVVMQLTKGNTLATFSGQSKTPVCSPGITEQIAFIQSLINAPNNGVIATFFGKNSTATAQFKDITPPSSTQTPGFGDDPSSFAISVNVILAVQ